MTAKYNANYFQKLFKIIYLLSARNYKIQKLRIQTNMLKYEINKKKWESIFLIWPHYFLNVVRLH